MRHRERSSRLHRCSRNRTTCFWLPTETGVDLFDAQGMPLAARDVSGGDRLLGRRNRGERSAGHGTQSGSAPARAEHRYCRRRCQPAHRLDAFVADRDGARARDRDRGRQRLHGFAREHFDRQETRSRRRSRRSSGLLTRAPFRCSPQALQHRMPSNHWRKTERPPCWHRP